MEKGRRLSDAIKDVKEKKFNVRKSAEVHQIPNSTLSRRVHNDALPSNATVVDKALNMFGKLTSCEDETLAKYIVWLDRRNRPMTYQELRTFALAIAKKRKEDTDLGLHWHYNFLQRHPNLKGTWSRVFASNRSAGMNYKVIQSNFR